MSTPPAPYNSSSECVSECHPLWEGTALKKGGSGFLESWKPRLLRVYADRVDYRDPSKGLALCGAMPLGKSSAVKRVSECGSDGDMRVDVHTAGRKEKASEAKGRVFHLKFSTASDRDGFVACVTQVLRDLTRAVCSLSDDGDDDDIKDLEPAVAVALPVNEFISLEENIEYSKVEDSAEVDFYHAAKRYIQEVDRLEQAWEARSQRRELSAERHILSPQSAQSPTKSRNSLIARAFGGKRPSWSTDAADKCLSPSLKRSSSGGISRYEDPLLGIEPFTKVDPKYSQGRFPNLFQKSPGGGYVQSVDELYTVAHSTLPALEELLYKLKGSLVENILEDRLGNTRDNTVTSDELDPEVDVVTECTFMSPYDALNLLASCNVHEYLDNDIPLSNTGIPSTCFPYTKVSPVASLVNILSGRVVCSTTAQVKAAVEYLLAHSTVVTLDNRFLDPLGQPNVYCGNDSPLCTSLLELEALSCNGSYHRDIRLVIAVNCGLNSDHHFLCEVTVETAEVHVSSCSGDDALGLEGGVVWNTVAEKALADRRSKDVTVTQSQVDGRSVSDPDEDRSSDNDVSGTWRDSLDLGTGNCSMYKNSTFYSRYLNDYFTKFRSWSHVEAVFSEMSIEEITITVRNNFSRDVIYRTELLRQVTEMSLEDYLAEREMFFDGLAEEGEEEGDEGAENRKIGRSGYFSTLLRATEMTCDVKMMRSVCSLFHGIGLYSASAVLQRVIVNHCRSQDQALTSSSFCCELETLAVLLLKDEGYDDQDHELIDEAASLLNESVAIREQMPQPEANNLIVIMNDMYILACIYNEIDDDGRDENENNIEECRAIGVLQELKKNKKMSEIYEIYFTAFLYPKLGLLCEQRGLIKLSGEYFEKAIKIQKEHIGDLHPVVYQTLLDYGLANLQPQGDMEKARNFVKESIKLRMKCVRDSCDMQRSLYCLAEGYMAQLPVYQAINDNIRCKSAIEKAFHIRRQLFGNTMHTSVAECYVEYGLLCKKMQKYDKAVVFFEESLKMYYELLGRETSEVADVLLHLAGVLELQQDGATALSMYKMSLKICRALYGAGSVQVSDVLLRLGALCVSEKLSDSAERLLFEALSLQCALYRRSDIDDSNCCGEVKVFTIKDASEDEVELKIAAQDLRPPVAETVNLIACNFKDKELLEDAMVWYQHSIDVTRAVYGVAHPNMALVWTHMAVLLKHQGKLKEAIALYERVLDLRRDASYGNSDDNNSLVAQSLNNLAIARQEIGEYKVAKTLFEEALDLYLGVFQGNARACSAELAALYNNLAGCLYQIDPRNAKVVLYGSKAVAMAEEVFGPDHSSTCRYRDNWANDGNKTS